MAENLYLRIYRGDEAPHLEWLALDEASGVVRFRGAGNFTEFTDLTREMSWSGEVRVMLPGEELLLTHAAIPSKQQRQVLQAIPYMVEESLASDIDECHFAAGPRDETGKVSVAVINHDYLRQTLAQLAAAGIRPTSVTPDVLHVPASSGTSILVDGERSLIRTGRYRGLAVDESLLPVAVNLLGESAGNLVVYLHPSREQAFQLYQSQIEADVAGEVSVEALDYTPFEFLCRSFDTHAINLLQGEFKVEDSRRRQSSAWRNVAVLAGCAFGLQVMLLIAQGIYLDVKASQYEREARGLYADVFPSDKNVRDIRRRWEAHLSAGSGQPTGAFFDLFSRAAEKLPGSKLNLENINFNEARGDLILQFSASQYDAFDKFAQALRKLGMTVDIGTISQDEDIVKGSIKIRGGA